MAHNLGVGPDAGNEVIDAALPPVVRVDNVGAACSSWGRLCEGVAAQCLEISYSGAFYAGGYCTADCRSSAECGAAGECPVGDAEASSPEYDYRSTWARKCFLRCNPQDPQACRAGYACMSLAEAYLAPDAPAPLHRQVCIPRLPTFGGDAGLTHRFDD